MDVDFTDEEFNKIYDKVMERMLPVLQKLADYDKMTSDQKLEFLNLCGLTWEARQRRSQPNP